MKSLHSIHTHPTLTNFQKALIVQHLEAGNRVRVRFTPVRHFAVIEVYRRSFWTGEMAWITVTGDPYTSHATIATRAKKFDPTQIEFRTGKR